MRGLIMDVCSMCNVAAEGLRLLLALENTGGMKIVVVFRVGWFGLIRRFPVVVDVNIVVLESTSEGTS